MGKGFKVSFLIILITCIYGIAQENCLTLGSYSKNLNGMHFQFDLNKDNTFEMFIDGSSLVYGTYTVKSDTVFVIDKGGQVACSPENKGIYTCACKNDSITFHVVKDDCQGRLDAMILGKWIKKAD